MTRRNCIVHTAGAAWLVLLLIGLAGCGKTDSQVPSVKIEGTVSYQGKPIPEGTIQFYDQSQGAGASATIETNGHYVSNSTLPYGTYQVFIQPPLIQMQLPNAAPTEQPKKMPEIPEKFRSAATSGLTADVSATSTVFDFDMK